MRTGVPLGVVPAALFLILAATARIFFALSAVFVLPLVSSSTGTGTPREADSQQGYADSGYERPAVVSVVSPLHDLLVLYLQ